VLNFQSYEFRNLLHWIFLVFCFLHLSLMFFESLDKRKGFYRWGKFVFGCVFFFVWWLYILTYICLNRLQLNFTKNIFHRFSRIILSLKSYSLSQIFYKFIQHPYIISYLLNLLLVIFVMIQDFLLQNFETLITVLMKSSKENTLFNVKSYSLC